MTEIPVTIRRAEKAADGDALRDLYTEVFRPEPVDVLAETLFHHKPRMDRKYWLMAEDPASGALVGACALIPWTWEMNGVRLRVAEMGLVGTRPSHRGTGVMRALSEEFARVVIDEGFDLSAIQGIPGFYHRLGYHYAIPLENHINVPLHLLPDEHAEDGYTVRAAGLDDIPVLLCEDDRYRAAYGISALRDEATWRYLLTDSRKTEYGSTFWILENPARGETFYARLPETGFGAGLIVGEISETITSSALMALLTFCRTQAAERIKPFIRLNVHPDSGPGRMAAALGAEPGAPYAWQVKIPDRVRLLQKLTPILERRLADSPFRIFSGTLRLDFYTSKIDLLWSSGRLTGVGPGDEADRERTLCIAGDLFAPLCLGHRTWRELQHNRPDIFPANQYTSPHASPASDITGMMFDTLFPPVRSWIHEQY